MTDAASLAGLAKRLGIEMRHRDALGVEHKASEDTILALVGAFGLPPDPERAAAALAEQEREAPLGLDPLQIVPAEEPQPSLELRLPPSVRSVEWQCRLENGDRRSGAGELGPAGRQCGGVRLTLPAGLPLGYHRFEVRAGGVEAQIGLAVAPAACHLPPALAPGARCWGLTTQLYGLRSARDWGIGDFSDLAALSRGAGALGAAVLGINPLHALFAAEPLHVSPYSPSSRLYLDYLYIDVTAVPGFAQDEAARGLVSEESLRAARAARFVDYRAVAALKRPVLEALFRRFAEQELGRDGTARSERGGAFRAFQQAGGRALDEFAAFEALHEHFRRQQGVFAWRDWPAPLRDPRSSAVAEFVRAQRERVAFFEFLQWEADRQLGMAAAAGRTDGLSIGLYRDLAVGVDPHGAEAWADQALVAPGASIGAPPDALSRAGQNWGLAPFNPLVLRRYGFAPFIAALRANMRHAGVLRLDHVMSLKRLYWIPGGKPATGGAYVNYPFDALLRLVALESHRHHCAVVGEDLGTVPEGFRETMQAANALSYRIVAFERREDGAFKPPSDYPSLAAASAATHDLATLKGFWLGRDIAWRRRLGLYPDAQSEAAETAARREDRRLLLEALAAAGVLEHERFGEFLSAEDEPRYTPALGDAILAFLARARSRLMLVQLEDLAHDGEQANLPGTNDEHRNWCRRMAYRLEELLGGGELRRIAAVIDEARREAPRAPRTG